MEAFDAYYRDTHPGSKPDWNATTIAMVKSLTKRLGVDEVVKRIRFLHESPPRFPPGPWDLKTFVGNVDNCVPTKRVEPTIATRSGMRPL